MATAPTEIKITVDMDTAMCEMFDIAQELEKLVDLVPGYNAIEAGKIKTRILDQMVGWIDGNAETKV